MKLSDVWFVSRVQVNFDYSRRKLQVTLIHLSNRKNFEVINYLVGKKKIGFVNLSTLCFLT